MDGDQSPKTHGSGPGPRHPRALSRTICKFIETDAMAARHAVAMGKDEVT
jgi:hypothetical protein